MIQSYLSGLRLLRSFRKMWDRRRNMFCRSPLNLAHVAGRSAGLARMEQAVELEALEARQLLFTVTIGPGDVDPETGIGTIKIPDFAYAIPYYFRQIPQAQPPEIVVEDFEDEAQQPWAQVVPPAPPNGTVFQDSKIQISFATASASPAILQAGPDFDDPQDLDLAISLSTTDQMTYLFQDGEQNTGYFPRLTQIAQITVRNGGDGDAINTDPTTGTRIELLLDGVVVDTLIGVELDAISAPALGGGMTLTLSRQLGFDSFRFSSAADAPANATYNDTFVLDDIAVAFPPGRFAQFSEERASFAVTGYFSGPAGASIQFLDLYGREILARLDTGIPANGTVPNIDRNDDGIPDWNDGIGKVIISNSDAKTSVSLWGGRTQLTNTDFEFVFPDNIGGLLDDMQQIGWGFELTQNAVFGLNSAGGSLVIGSVFDRGTDPTTYLNTPPAPTPSSFVNPNQGIFVDGSIKSILIDGMILGSSAIDGAAGRVSFGTLLGSLRVEGDLGSLTVGSDAGLWQSENASGKQWHTTSSQLVVGRTVGEIAVGGRSNLDITVLADINNPSRDVYKFLDYYEREVVQAINPNVQNPVAATVSSILGRNATPETQTVPWAGGLYRNETLADAEYIGYNGTTVRINGQLGALDPINTAEDISDVYAFAADGTQDIVIAGADTGYARIVDRHGRVLAALDYGSAGRGRGGNITEGSVFRFRPDHADVYYLVMSLPPDGNPASAGYTVTITGIAATTLGSFRAAMGAGGGGADNDPFVLSLNSGSMGAIRIGTGTRGSDGSEVNPGQVINTGAAEDQQYEYGQSSSSIAGNLYSIYTGSDVAGATVLVGRNFGTLITGQAIAFVGNNLQGDLTTFDLRVGGTISVLEIQGAAAADQDTGATGSLGIRTGTLGGEGHIGRILVGAYATEGLSVQTSPGSIIEQFLVGYINDGAGTQSPGALTKPPLFRLGAGSDIRFVDFARIYANNNPDAVTTINFGQSFVFVDDAGAAVRVSVIAGPASGSTAAQSSIQVRTLAINGSQGVAVARISGTLLDGARLVLTALTPGVVSIGRIEVNVDQLGSEIRFDGVGEIDVDRINVSGGPLGAIRNSTVGGDIIAIDAAALSTLVISHGNLGTTQTSPVITGEALGKFVGLIGGRGGGGGGGQIGGPLAIDAAAANGSQQGIWDGTTMYFPVDGLDDWNAPWPLEMAGSPLDPYLNGLVVRGGDLLSVTVSGSVGDVLVENGDLISLVANSDNVTPPGEFHGIVGTIYAVAINAVDIGDGLKGTGASAFAKAGIFADDDIVTINATRIAGARIEGTIIAGNVNSNQDRTTIGNQNPIPLVNPVNGLHTVELRNGRFDGALIRATALNDFWQSRQALNDPNATGTIQRIGGTNSDFFRSMAYAQNFNTIQIVGGAYDSSRVISEQSIDRVIADEFRNTTARGQSGEFLPNSISATNNIRIITTNGRLGNISDLSVSAGGSVTGEISGRNIERSNFAINNQITGIFSSVDFRGNTIVTGELILLQVAGDIRSSSLQVAGPVRQITANGEITLLDLLSSGPFGRIDLIRSVGQMTGNFVSSGPIGTIESVSGDIIATITTTDASDGTLGTLRAGRDLRTDLSIASDATLIQAGRHVGAPGEPRSRAIEIRGNLSTLLAPNGQIYSDVLVGQSITGSITNGRVSMLATNDQVSSGNIISYGRINLLNLKGDFNGDIVSYSGGIGSIIITDGSFRQNNRIAAYNGDIDLIRLVGGDLLGNIYTEGTLRNLELLTGADGWESQIGVANFKRNNIRWLNDVRNQLPPGVARTALADGARIEALRDIDRVYVQSGSVWESIIQAGGTIGLVDVGGNFRNDALTTGRRNVVAAGDRISTLRILGSSNGIFVLAGIKSFGDNQRPGGTGIFQDTVKEGTIGDIFVGNGTANFFVLAGVDPGLNGSYFNADDTFAVGVSSLGSFFVNGAIANTRARVAGSLGAVSGGIITDISQPQAQPAFVVGVTGIAVNPGALFNFTTTSGQQGSFIYSGGSAFWNAITNRITLSGAVTSLTVNANLNVLTNFNILSTDNTTLSSLVVNAELRGSSNVFVDGSIGSATFNRVVDSSGSIGSGGNIASLTFNQGLLDGNVSARNLDSLVVTGDLGKTGSLSDAIVLVRDLGLLRVTGGQFAGTVSSDLDIDFAQFGVVNQGGLRAGREISSFTASSVNASRISARDRLGTVTVNGDVLDTAFLAGVDLGSDANFGGTAFAADTVTNGSIGSVSVFGNFRESDISAGVLRGVDGFLGTDDDRAADGRSSIGTVAITGLQVGSNFNSEQYRIISTGTIGNVTLGGLAFTNRNNFRVTRLTGTAIPVQVDRSRTIEDGRVYTHEITFNSPVDASTIAAALSIAEVRPGGVLVGLAQGTDYTFRYNPTTFTLAITFSLSVTERNLPVTPGVPGPGLMRIVLDANTLRGLTLDSRLDGNGDGTAGDDYSNDDFIGDVGDKISASNASGFDLYGAGDLDLFLDLNNASDDLPDANRTFTLRGAIGDHPDSNSNTFRIGGDVDVYKITLRAGQILRLGAMQGIALRAQRGIFDSSGNLLAFSGAGRRTVLNEAGLIRQLPAAEAVNVGDVTGNDEYLVMTTGTYYIAIGTALEEAALNDGTNIQNLAPVAGSTGSYIMDIQVFDDGDTGFAGDSNSGDGQSLPTPPVPQNFAGGDGIPGTNDDLATFVIGDFTFVWNRNNLSTVADDEIRGVNAAGDMIITRTVGTDSVWGNPNDRIVNTVNSAIGVPGNSGTPSIIQPDIDIFRLNGGNPIAPGTQFTITFRLTETGSNIGLPGAAASAAFETAARTALGGLQTQAANLPRNVQFAIFELPVATGFGDARLVAAPSDFLPIGSQDQENNSNGAFSYGYNPNGDFFMRFTVPGAQGIVGAVPASYAIYLQGVIRSDYQLEVVQTRRGSVAPKEQNILLETNGGVIDWLEAGAGIQTTLDAFRAGAVGFSGQIGGTDVQNYLQTQLITKLNTLFTTAGVRVNFSYSPSSFEGQKFSTVFLAGNPEPNAFFDNDTFGASQHVDAFNVDITDQAVVFVTSLTTQGNDPSQAGVDRFVDQLTAATARRIGELLGISMEVDNADGTSPVPLMGANSVETAPTGGGVYEFNNGARSLAGRNDKANNQIFFLGTQHSLNLIKKNVAVI